MTVVVDASVALKWVIEEDGSQAAGVLLLEDPGSAVPVLAAGSSIPRCLPSRSEPCGDAARQQKVIAAARVHHAGAPCGGGADAPEQIAAHRTLDCAAGILCEDEPAHTFGR